MKACPKCGNDESYYVEQRVTGKINFYINYDGTEAENSEMYEHLKHKTLKYGYCSNCNKRLFKVDENMRPVEVTNE
jgi:uncharacterized protein with PIN domain